MAHPDPARSHEHDDQPDISSRNARYGLILLALYVALYAGFMGLSAFQPELMSRAGPAGVNLAILYGMGLIVAAFVLAAVYMFLCRQRPDGT